MPAENIRQRLSNLSLQDQDNLRPLLEAIVDALEAIAQDSDKNQNDVLAIDATLDTLVAKLNLDTGITDTDYANATTLTAGGTTETSLDGFIVKV